MFELIDIISPLLYLISAVFYVSYSTLFLICTHLALKLAKNS